MMPQVEKRFSCMHVYYGRSVTFKPMRVFQVGVWRGFQHVQRGTMRRPCCHSRVRNGRSRVSHVKAIVVTCLLDMLGDIINNIRQIGKEKMVCHHWKCLEKKYCVNLTLYQS